MNNSNARYLNGSFDNTYDCMLSAPFADLLLNGNTYQEGGRKIDIVAFNGENLLK